MTMLSEKLSFELQAKYLLNELGNTTPSQLQVELASNLVRYQVKQLANNLRNTQSTQVTSCIADRIAHRQFILLTHSFN